MDPDGLPVIGSGVDFSQVGAIHQKRTLAFINYFVTSTVSFLNNFSRSCEVRLQKCESRIQKLEASLGILEAKLSSIPGLDEVKSGIDDAPPSISMESKSTSEIVSQTPLSDEVQVDLKPQEQVPVVSSDMVLVKDHPLYKRFFRLLHVGVPEPAVRLKMQADGLDPGMLSNPEQQVPAYDQEHTQDSSHDSSDSGTD